MTKTARPRAASRCPRDPWPRVVGAQHRRTCRRARVAAACGAAMGVLVSGLGCGRSELLAGDAVTEGGGGANDAAGGMTLDGAVAEDAPAVDGPTVYSDPTS